ncbi:MAG: tetratricopeptide repeat protein [Anaerolineales bacterium]
MTLSEYILDVSEGTFENDVLMRSHETPVIVDFWAEWCAPCKMLGPLLERLANEWGGSFLLAKVDVDENPNLAIRYGVQGIPAVKAIQNGEVVSEFVGAQPESIVRRFVQNLVPSEADKAVAEAQSLLATRHWPEAEDAFREVLEQDESNATAALGLVKSLLMQGKGKESGEILADFPAGTEWPVAESLRPLADALVEAEGAEQSADDDTLSARLHRAANLIARGNLPAAMDGLLDILREDKTYRGGLPKQIMLALFVLLGDQDPLTREYREELASVLF